MSETTEAVATPDSAIVSNPDAPVTSSSQIERTPEQIEAGAKAAAERAAQGDPNAPKLPADAAKPTGESKLPEKEAEAAPAAEEEAPQVDDKNPLNVPPKFLNEDGTPDYKRLTESYLNQEKLLSKKGFSNVSKPEELTYTPGKDATPIPDENLKAFQEKAFKAGMTKEQFSTVMAEYEVLFKNQSSGDDAYRLPSINDSAAMSKVKATLEGVIGKGEDFTAGIQRAVKVVDTFLPSQFKMTDPVFNHPAVVSLLANIGAELGEDKVTGKDKVGLSTAGLRTPAEVRADPDYARRPQFYEDGEIMKYYKAQPGGNNKIASSQQIR